VEFLYVHFEATGTVRRFSGDYCPIWRHPKKKRIKKLRDKVWDVLYPAFDRKNLEIASRVGIAVCAYCVSVVVDQSAISHTFSYPFLRARK
jgi:hypothetical protein